MALVQETRLHVGADTGKPCGCGAHHDETDQSVGRFRDHDLE